MRLKVWFMETRPQFFLLSIVLAFLGTAIAWYDGYFNLAYALLAGFGLTLTHISVNVLNDYFDFRSGVDLKTHPSPFNGGSGILVAGALTQQQVLWLGIASIGVAVPIGVYFTVVSGLELLPLLLVAAFCVILYSPLILKQAWPEWAPGVGLGALPVLGMYFVQSGAYTTTALIGAIPSALLVHNLLLANELPDAEADTVANRKTLPITIGKDKAQRFYAICLIAMYVWIVVWVALGRIPIYGLVALLTTPLAVKAIRLTRQHQDPSKLIPGLGANVLVVLLTQLLLGIGYILGRALG